MSDSRPPRTETEMRLQIIMEELVKAIPDQVIILFIAPFGSHLGNRVNYISNANRDDMKVMMKEIIARWEGRYQSASGNRQ